MLQKFLTVTIAMALTGMALAQESVTTTTAATVETAPKDEKKFPVTISGYVDAYFRFNFANAKSAGATNNKTSFTNSQNSFELGMASLKLEHTTGKVGVVADLGFGTRADEFSYNETAQASGGSANSKFIIKQAYLTYAPSSNFKLTAGSWATHVGYELVDPYLNRNYSMSYLFSYGPFFHTGIKGEYTFGKNLLMLGIANPTDLKSASFTQKMLIGQYSIASKNDKLKLYLNYQGGKASDAVKLNQYDAVITGTVTDKFSVGVNGTVQSLKQKGVNGKYGDTESWWGTALYLNVDPQPWFGLTLRGEYFDDKKFLTAATVNPLSTTGVRLGGNIFETTLSANFKIDNLTILPEFRYESASKNLFVKDDGTGTKSTASVLLAAIYKF
jgi:Putative beta-barrel porin-2, OmpL-like. bbp2